MIGEDQSLLLTLDREQRTPLHAQLERELREAVRSGRLSPGAVLPSSRALARRLGLSRGVVVEAYAQLGAEGYLSTRQGSATRVASAAAPRRPARPSASRPSPRYDFHPGLPDVGAFPRVAWARSLRRAIAEVRDADLGYGDVRGAAKLREALASYLGRARGAVVDPERVQVSSGHVQAFALLCRALSARGVERIALEDPGFVLHRAVAARAGLRCVPVAVDRDGIDPGGLHATGAGAVLVTPAHQSPTGAVLSPARRRELVEWAQDEGAVVIEDDYNSEFRFDREPVGALQGLAPERVVYCGSASKTLAPALRLAWLVLPESLAEAVAAEKALDDLGSPVLDQLALADLLDRGELDRHLRRMRPRYRARRAALIAALRRRLPEAWIGGVEAGLHAVATLPAETDEAALIRAGAARGVALHGLAWCRFDESSGPPGLVLGYAAMPEAAIERGVAELAAAFHETGLSARPRPAPR